MVYPPNQLTGNVVSFHKITSHDLKLRIEVQSHLIKLAQPLTKTSKSWKFLIVRETAKGRPVITIVRVVPLNTEGIGFRKFLFSIVSEVSNIGSNSRDHRHVNLELVKSHLVRDKLLIRLDSHSISLVNRLLLSLSSDQLTISKRLNPPNPNLKKHHVKNFDIREQLHSSLRSLAYHLMLIPFHNLGNCPKLLQI